MTERNRQRGWSPWRRRFADRVSAFRRRFHVCWPLRLPPCSSFTDVVVNRPVYRAVCRCGRIYLTFGRWNTFRVEVQPGPRDTKAIELRRAWWRDARRESTVASPRSANEGDS